LVAARGKEDNKVEEIRNSKHEIRNKLKIQNSDARNEEKADFPSTLVWFTLFWSFGIRSFRFVSNFGFRISDLKKQGILMNSRDIILSRIRTALAGRPQVETPPVCEVWPRQNPDKATMLARFAEELEAVQGELIRCASLQDAQAKLAELMTQSEWPMIAAVDIPPARELLAGIAGQISWTQPGWEASDMADLPAGLVVADYLLADTGSCVVTGSTVQERLMCYLPPVCVVLARADQLAEHLPAVWPELARRAAAPETRGEFVIITGPSRTADIEKILILGVHGPKRLIVLLVD
jgi:L-lactate dehydrogenase complex protein LldG